MSGYEQWVALLTLMRKEIKRYTRIWTQTLLPSAITMSLYFLIFGSLIGERIGQMGGVSYMEFVVPGLINAVFANTFADISIVPTFVLTPLTYLGGVFYSLDLLPDFWASVSQANPLVYVVNAFRYGVLGVSDVDVTFAFAMIGVFTLIAYFYAAHLLRSGTRLRT